MKSKQFTKNIISSISILILFITFPAILKAEFLELSVSSYVDRTQIIMGNSLQLTVEIEANKNVDVEPIIPQLTGFQIIGQSSSSSSSIQIINGKVDKSITKSFTYTLAPLKLGNFVIPPIEVKYDRKKYKTNSIRVNIIKGNSSTQTSPNNLSQSQRTSPNSAIADGRKMFLQAIPTKRNVYMGEPFAIIYKIYSRKELSGLQPEQMPNFPGFIKEDVFQATNIRYTLENLKGIRYYTYKISEYTLFAIHEGDFKLDPMQLVGAYNTPARSFFDFGNTKRVMLSSQPITIHVKKLPLIDRPEDYTGAVGTFSIKAELGKHEVKAGESITLTVTISGSGNIKMFDAPLIPQINNIGTFPPEENNTLTDSYKTAGYKTIKFILIPQEPGKYEIPPIKFSYFNTQTGKYSTVETKSCHFTAEKSDIPLSATSYVNPKGIVVQGIDINFIINKNVIYNNSFLVQKLWFWLIAVLGMVILFIAFLIKKESDKLLSDRGYYKLKISNKQLKTDLKFTRKVCNDENGEVFFPAIEKTLKNYIANKFNLSAAGMQLQEVIDVFEANGIDTDLTEKVKKFLMLTDQARFSGFSYSEKDMKENLSQLEDIIGKLQKIKFRRKK